MENVTAQDCARMMESLSLVMQESAERGNMESNVYADLSELMGILATHLRDSLKGRCAA